jgi:hypothetical protein
MKTIIIQIIIQVSAFYLFFQLTKIGLYIGNRFFKWNKNMDEAAETYGILLLLMGLVPIVLIGLPIWICCS